jgi:hypothetical protein
MNRQVNVSSIAALRRFQRALREFGEALQDVLAALQIESQRTVDWIQVDRMTYWPQQIRLAEETLNESLNRLQLKQLTLDGRDRPACSEERDAVYHARRRLRYSEQQWTRTRQLAPQVQHQADEYRGILAKLSQLVETDVPRAIAALDRMATSLEKYVAAAAPSTAAPAKREERP